jgi:hypothetical protein
VGWCGLTSPTSPFTLQEGITPKDHAIFEQYWIGQFAGLLNVSGNKPALQHSAVARQVIAAIQDQLERARKGEQV